MRCARPAPFRSSKRPGPMRRTRSLSVEPEAIVLAEPCPDRAQADGARRALAAAREKAGGLYMPVIARTRDDGAPCCPTRWRLRPTRRPRAWCAALSTALRIRTLHGTVLRRIRTLASRGEQLPELPANDPLDEANVLVAGRGRSYPTLSVAVGERVGVVGALSRRERGARAQCPRHRRHGDRRRFRPEDRRSLADRARRRRALSRSAGRGARRPPGVIEPFAIELANLERIAEGPQRLVERFLPYVRAARVRRSGSSACSNRSTPRA